MNDLERIESDISAAESALRSGAAPEGNLLLWLMDSSRERELIMAEYGLFSNNLGAKIVTGHNSGANAGAALSKSGLRGTANA